MLSDLLSKARNDEPLWLPELRSAFLADPTARPLRLRLTLHDGTRRDFPCAIPRWKNAEEQQFAAEFLYACVYNLLAVYSGQSLTLFFDTVDAELCELFDNLDTVFQIHESTRRGYGKVISIASRIAASYGGEAFRFVKADLSEHTPLPEAAAADVSTPLNQKLHDVCRAGENLALCGIDVGGTDIKLAASDGERLVCTKEYDWNPAGYKTAEEIIEPILLLTRLMRACLAAERAKLTESTRAKLLQALSKDAPLAFIRETVEEAETALGSASNMLDGVGLSFPDIVIGDRILGGETPKTDGMRRNTALDYEQEFKKLSGLTDALARLRKKGGSVRITNDGNMAAFTAAVELAQSSDATVAQFGQAVGANYFALT